MDSWVSWGQNLWFPRPRPQPAHVGTMLVPRETRFGDQIPSSTSIDRFEGGRRERWIKFEQTRDFYIMAVPEGCPGSSNTGVPDFPAWRTRILVANSITVVRFYEPQSTLVHLTTKNQGGGPKHAGLKRASGSLDTRSSAPLDRSALCSAHQRQAAAISATAAHIAHCVRAAGDQTPQSSSPHNQQRRAPFGGRHLDSTCVRSARRTHLVDSWTCTRKTTDGRLEVSALTARHPSRVSSNRPERKDGRNTHGRARASLEARGRGGGGRAPDASRPRAARAPRIMALGSSRYRLAASLALPSGPCAALLSARGGGWAGCAASPRGSPRP